MDLSHLTIKIIEAMGGVAIFAEYGLAQVLLPDIYKERFQGRTELLLAFDYEVAEENPNADFITFGSEVLETLLDIAMHTAISDVRYVIVDRVEVINSGEKVRKAITKDGLDSRFDVTVLTQRPVMGIFSSFVFRTKFMSSESFEEEQQVWINMLTGNIDNDMSAFTAFYEKKPIFEYPYAKITTFSEAYSKAHAHITLLCKEIAEIAVSPNRIAQETERLKSYYEELIEENKRRLRRKGLSAEKQEEISKKHEALQLEMERQISEIRENLIPTPTTLLAHGITFHIPLIELSCNISGRQGTELRRFYYECLTKQVFEVDIL